MLLFRIISVFFNNLKAIGVMLPTSLSVMMLVFIGVMDWYILSWRTEFLYEFGRTKKMAKRRHPVAYWTITGMAAAIMLIPFFCILFMPELMDLVGGMQQWARQY